MFSLFRSRFITTNWFFREFMSMANMSNYVLRSTIFVLCALQSLPGFGGAEKRVRRPNIIIVLADDLGWSDLECYGSDFNETPHVNRLAERGVRLTQAYAAAPVCSPYRAALMTGQYPARHGILDYLRPNSGRPLSISHVTLPELLQQNGYATGIIGKWHLSGYKYHGAEHEVPPSAHGFAESFGTPVKGVGNGANFFPYVFRTQPISWLRFPEHRLGADEYLTDRINLESVDFIERHQDEPFFLYVSHFAPHTILNGKPDLVEKYRRKHAPGASTRSKCYLCEDAGHSGDHLNHWAGDHNPHLAAMLESVDDGVGMIVSQLQTLGLTDNTLVIFTSDNGGETNVTSNTPLRGGKSELYEGGIRVPLIASWAGHLPENAVSSHVTSNVDLYPTLLDAAAIAPAPAPEQVLDGRSILNSLKAPHQSQPPVPLYWHYPLDRPHFLKGRSSGAVRDDDWKLIEFYDTDEVELYSLKDDAGESNNLAKTRPDKTAELHSKLVAWRRQLGVRNHDGPLMVETRALVFEDSFEPGTVSERWFFQKEWSVNQGRLTRNEIAGINKRIFITKPQFRNALIRFDFQLGSANEIRLMTGSDGHYNTVVHIRPDQFFIQTAVDKSVPFFPSYQGECAFSFQSDEWYTMTIELAEDECIAHVDHQHVALAQHPIIDRERTYFAFQVDQPSASFDNVEVLTAKQRKDWPASRAALLSTQVSRPWMQRAPDERYQMLKANVTDRLYRSDPGFRDLVTAVAAAKESERQMYPEVFLTIKQVRKEIGDYRQELLKSDPRYKQLRDTINQRQRSIVKFLESRDTTLKNLPSTDYKAALERTRQRYITDADYLQIVRNIEMAELQCKETYPRLFITNEEIQVAQRAARKRLSDTPDFKATIQVTASAVRAEREYLLSANAELAELHHTLFGSQVKKSAPSK
jgi:arylsulfatase A